MQPSLFGVEPKLPQRERKPRERRLTMQEQFDKWAAVNEPLIQLYLRYAREAKQSGLKHYGVKAIAERVRWYVQIENKGEDFKVNNNYSSRLARLLMELDPFLEGFFELRKIKA